MAKKPEEIASEIHSETGIAVPVGIVKDIQQWFRNKPLKEAMDSGLVGDLKDLVVDDERELRKMLYGEVPELRGKIDLSINTEPELKWKKLKEIV